VLPDPDPEEAPDDVDPAPPEVVPPPLVPP
jgi:hypothetical protein